MTDFSVAPGVLIAVPQLDDSNFERSVIVMIKHTADGALGLVINSELEHPCEKVVAEFDLSWAGEPCQLRRGGPVESQSLWMLHHDRWSFDETMQVADGVNVSRSREAITKMCEGAEQHMVLLVGYAGWGGGQLEAEIKTGSWIVGKMSPELVFEWPAETVWSRALAELGINPAHLVEGAGMIQ